MPLPLRDAADMRRWQPAAGFDLDAHAPFFAEESWGYRFPCGTDGLPGNVRAHLRVVPECLSLHARCARCGGRHEAVVDFRSLDEVCFGARAEAAHFEGFGEDRAQYLEFVLLQQPLRAWADQHLRCAPTPELEAAPELRDDVARVVRLVEALAIRDLREQGIVEATVALVPHEGTPLWFDADGEDEAARALTAFRVREVTDRERFPDCTLVLAEEMPGTGPDPLWRMAVLAEEGCWSAIARIHRERGVRHGPGLLDPPTWSMLRDDDPWIDGLRAARIFFPITRPGAPQH
jgi:hypothetical protein